MMIRLQDRINIVLVVIDGGKGNNEISDSCQFSENDLISNIKGKTTLSDSIELKANETINVKINGINYKIYNKRMVKLHWYGK
ncbi:MAG: hypothetical protein L6V95_08015 [Candidatus Melainabacteria bacterium]|nr:MAG: hypothetical protein L6V95_08015 [Candidatus Melainabacteria bacterium]